MASKVVENGTEGWKAHSLPPGDYHLIGWDVDTTGRRLVDEICQIAAYTPTDNFSQYVMPFQELNPAARRRHNIRVVTIGRFRMLKDSKTNKVLKTKSEISALTDFVQWLEGVKGKSSDGVILVSHESRKVAAPLLLEALRKYNMLDKFSSVVKGFANGYNVAEVKCAKTIRSFSLRTLSRVLLDKDEELDSAVDRARLSFQIVQHLCGGEERQGSGDGDETTAPGLVLAISEFTQTIAQEEEELARVKTVLDRQNSLRPVFAPMLRREKNRAVNIRKLVAESGIDYDMLTSTFKLKGNEGICELISSKLPRARAKDVEDLKNLLKEHFEGENNKPGENKPLPQRTKPTSASNTASQPNSTANDSVVPVVSSTQETTVPLSAPSSTSTLTSNPNSTPVFTPSLPAPTSTPGQELASNPSPTPSTQTSVPAPNITPTPLSSPASSGDVPPAPIVNETSKPAEPVEKKETNPVSSPDSTTKNSSSSEPLVKTESNSKPVSASKESDATSPNNPSEAVAS
ncbi:Maternal protein exuperantia [Gryllus bimaculatus]|nr:Maternal protein exuperantia [Gryllus bimaculatus]